MQGITVSILKLSFTIIFGIPITLLDYYNYVFIKEQYTSLLPEAKIPVFTVSKDLLEIQNQRPFKISLITVTIQDQSSNHYHVTFLFWQNLNY